MEKQQKPILKCLVGLDWGSKPQCATLTIISPMRFHENESQGQVTHVFTMINRLYMVTETDLIAKTLHFLMPTSEKTIPVNFQGKQDKNQSFDLLVKGQGQRPHSYV